MWLVVSTQITTGMYRGVGLLNVRGWERDGKREGKREERETDNVYVFPRCNSDLIKVTSWLHGHDRSLNAARSTAWFSIGGS